MPCPIASPCALNSGCTRHKRSIHTSRATSITPCTIREREILDKFERNLEIICLRVLGSRASLSSCAKYVLENRHANGDLKIGGPVRWARDVEGACGAVLLLRRCGSSRYQALYHGFGLHPRYSR